MDRFRQEAGVFVCFRFLCVSVGCVAGSTKASTDSPAEAFEIAAKADNRSITNVIQSYSAAERRPSEGNSLGRHCSQYAWPSKQPAKGREEETAQQEAGPEQGWT